jgi:hypothetical protein
LTDKCWKRDQFNTLLIDRKGSNAPQLFFRYFAFYFVNTNVTNTFCARFPPLTRSPTIFPITLMLSANKAAKVDAILGLSGPR